MASEATRRYRRSENGRAAARANKKQWGLRNPEKLRAQRRKNYALHREARLRYVFEKKYGITFEQRDEILAAQGNACALCGSPDPCAGKRGWHTDHDWTKQKGEIGFIRGILCMGCNTGLGHFDHSVQLLQRAQEYLGSTCHSRA